MSSSQPTSAPTSQIRELAARESDGIRVVLLWNPHEDAVTLTLEDTRDGDRLDLVLPRDRALHAFYHPFAYVPRTTAFAPLLHVGARVQSRLG
jgi:hypothetical protein